ncbi:MAG: cysteine--tRNA ligase [Nitrospina sp.]|jgi:cysteinyl-tRNA synthetase|nr:cysteine--tRNA ligase [Nitrospina sp.]
MNLLIFNTLSGKKEVFEPLRENKVGMYVCGVTVYDYCHVGHARSGVVFDIIFRYLKHCGYDVKYVRNFTDIDDKIINRSKEQNVSWEKLTEKFIQAFYDDMGQLHIQSPTEEPKATDHIQEMLDMISSLIERGKAYESGGDVFYSVNSFDGYGQLSGKNIEDLQAGARVDVNENKSNALDFVLWKKSKPDEPAWDSPWGKGRPGWHIECSAMGRKYFGESFDIHGGGKDLVFPHHENEIAQSCGVTGCLPARYWVHNGFVNVDKEKMSKSLDNFFTLRDIFKKFHPEALRLFLISSHYRSPIDFSMKNLEDAEKVILRFYEALENARTLVDDCSVSLEEIKSSSFLAKCEKAMNDDFNTAVVVAHLNEESRGINFDCSRVDSGEGEKRNLAVRLATFKFVGELLGLLTSSLGQIRQEIFEVKKTARELDVERIECLVNDRNEARNNKDWGRADQCRDELKTMGIVLEDTSKGTEWKIK